MKMQDKDRKILIIEWLVGIKAKSVSGSIHFWIILLLMAGLGYLYNRFSNTYYDVYSLLFFYPMIYAAVVYRLRGVIFSGLVFLIILFFPVILWGGDYQLLIRAVLFGLLALVLSGMVATLLNYSELQFEVASDLRRLITQVGNLGLERQEMLHFLNMAAHDMKAPLTAMQSYFRFILDGYSGTITAKQKQMIERSARRSDSLIRFIADLLDISRLESGRFAPEFREVSLAEIIRDSLDELRPQAGVKKLVLRKELPAALPPVRGNRRRLQQVIVNLVDNAVRYTERGSVTVRARERAGEVVVEVEDTGIGIKADALSHIFEDFFRIGDVESEGSGLGLGICQRIIEAHGGRLWAESPCPGGVSGSRFTFALPLANTTTKS